MRTGLDALAKKNDVLVRKGWRTDFFATNPFSFDFGIRWKIEKILQSCETEGLASVWESKAGKYHSAMLGLHPDRLGLHPDGLGLHPDRLGLHPDGLGLHPDGLGLYLDGLGYRAPQNSQKIDFLLKKIVLYEIFYRFVCTKPVFTRFLRVSIDFS